MKSLKKPRSLLEGRCATCKHWEGNREFVLEKLNKAIYENRLSEFLNPLETWAAFGECETLDKMVGFNAEPEGVFGCILHESI